MAVPGPALTDTALRLPILVGITGKRILVDGELASVQRRLTKTFRRLDKMFPDVPKVLLTGGAYGADTLAARLVLAREPDGRARFPRWSVVVLLPFDRDLFEKDFRPGNAADPAAVAQSDLRLSQLNEVCTATERVRVRVLPPLRAAGHGTGEICREQLDKDSPQACTTARHEHYEQVGQFIAETSTILIAVMERETVPDHADANGSTARVVACRRAGRPDKLGLQVARRSVMLRDNWDSLVDPPAAYVWLIEPAHRAKVRRYPVAVLAPQPAEAGAATYAARDKSEGRRWRHGARAKRALDASLTIPRNFNRLNRASAATSMRGGTGPSFTSAAMDPVTDPMATIAHVRQSISPHQHIAKAKSEAAFLFISLAFIAAIFSLELYAKFFPTQPIALFFYLLFFVFIFGVILYARRKHWQPLAEDLRVVMEMLRVQRAWWSAGLTLRVDREHLQSLDAELLRIRDATRAILGWIWLRAEWSARPASDWPFVRGAAAAPRSTASIIDPRCPAPTDWIGSQIHYFATNYRLCRRRVRRLDAFTWSLFATSGWIAMWLLLRLTSEKGWISLTGCVSWVCLLDRPLASPAPLPLNLASIGIVALYAMLAAALISVWCLIANLSDSEHASYFWPRLFATAAVGAVVALFCVQAVLVGVAFLPLDPDEHELENIIRLSVVTFVTLSAIAGATRYYTEKLNLAAQAVQYRDALEPFERAERLLALGADPINATPAEVEAARQIVRDLAKLALRENENWLKARRERPLSPVIG